MDALQQPWTGAGQKYLPTFYSNMEMQTKLQKKAMDLRIEDIQLMTDTGDVQKRRKYTSLEETVRRNAAKILQFKEKEEELERELEELKQRMASMKKSREEESLPELGVQRGMEIKMMKRQRQMEKASIKRKEMEQEEQELQKLKEKQQKEMEREMEEKKKEMERELEEKNKEMERELKRRKKQMERKLEERKNEMERERKMIEKKRTEKDEHVRDVERSLEKQMRNSTIRGKLEAMKRKVKMGRKIEAKKEKHSQMEMVSDVEKEREMTEVGKMKRQRWRVGKERRETEEEKPRENLDQEPMKQKEEDLLQELVQQKEQDMLQDPVKQSKEDLLQEPVKQKEEELLQQLVQQREKYLLQELVQQREKYLLQELMQQREEQLLQEPLKLKHEEALQEPVKQKEEHLLQESVKQREEDLLQESEMQTEEDLLQEPVKQREEDLLQEPVKQSEEDLLQEPVKQREEDLLQESEMQTEEDLLQEPVKQREEDLLQEPVKQREEDLLQEPVKQSEEDLLQEPVKQRKENQKDDRERQLEMQKARQDHMDKQQQRKKEQLRRMYAPGHNWFISENGAQRRGLGGKRMRNKICSEEKKEENTDLENKQENLQRLSWPVSPNGEGLLINVKPLHPCTEPEEEPRDLTPSTAESTKDPTRKNLEEQEINATPEEPSPHPHTFSEPQKDMQIFTDGSKLPTEEDEEEETSSQADDPKESVLRTFPKGSMVQCCVQRERTDKNSTTYRMFQELEDGEKLLLVARRMKNKPYVITVDESDEAENAVWTLRSHRYNTEYTLYDGDMNPSRSCGALQKESSAQVLLAVSYAAKLGFIKTHKMTAVIPSLDRKSQRVGFVEGSTLKEIKDNNQGANMIELETKMPEWNKKKRAYMMDFNGRVKLGSVKNFQLVCPASPDQIILQFGREDEDRFVLDYSFPLCALQAFAIGLSCFDE
ncbi:hypothetical protein MHYP_G00142080 [Metynnis hypsauchen]